MFDVHTHNKDVVNGIVSCGVYDNTDGLKCLSMGIHPWNVSVLWEEELETMVRNCVSNEVSSRLAAIGEIGIDKVRGGSMQLQKDCFKAQLYVAEKLRKPVILHCVKAVSEVLACLKEVKFSQPVVFHGFRGRAPMARQLLVKGYYLSFGPNFNAESLRLAYGVGQMYLETDDSGVSIEKVYESASKVLSIPPTDIVVPGIFRSCAI